jgi:hypothetical protein
LAFGAVVVFLFFLGQDFSTEALFHFVDNAGSVKGLRAVAGVEEGVGRVIGGLFFITESAFVHS